MEGIGLKQNIPAGRCPRYRRDPVPDRWSIFWKKGACKFADRPRRLICMEQVDQPAIAIRNEITVR